LQVCIRNLMLAIFPSSAYSAETELQKR
jgi:hypothetical protein